MARGDGTMAGSSDRGSELVWILVGFLIAQGVFGGGAVKVSGLEGFVAWYAAHASAVRAVSFAFVMYPLFLLGQFSMFDPGALLRWRESLIALAVAGTASFASTFFLGSATLPSVPASEWSPPAWFVPALTVGLAVVGGALLAYARFVLRPRVLAEARLVWVNGVPKAGFEEAFYAEPGPSVANTTGLERLVKRAALHHTRAERTPAVGHTLYEARCGAAMSAEVLQVCQWAAFGLLALATGAGAYLLFVR